MSSKRGQQKFLRIILSKEDRARAKDHKKSEKPAQDPGIDGRDKECIICMEDEEMNIK